MGRSQREVKNALQFMNRCPFVSTSQASLDHICHIVRVLVRDRAVFHDHHLSEESVQVSAFKWLIQSAHLVENASE